MLIKKVVFDNPDDAIGYMKACGAAVERVYYYPAEDRYYVDIVVDESAAPVEACGVGGARQEVIFAFDKNYMVNSLI